MGRATGANRAVPARDWRRVAAALIVGGAAGVAALPAAAQDHRELGAHVHGESHLNIAIEGARVVLELHAPGVDIVGFEHEAETDADKAAVAAALDVLRAPLALFAPTAAAGCAIESATAELVEEEHEAAAAAPAGGAPEAEEHHAEFAASYALVCADPGALRDLAFPYFDAFPNAEIVEVQVIGPRGTSGADVERSRPAFDLGGVM